MDGFCFGYAIVNRLYSAGIKLKQISLIVMTVFCCVSLGFAAPGHTPANAKNTHLHSKKQAAKSRQAAKKNHHHFAKKKHLQQKHKGHRHARAAAPKQATTIQKSNMAISTLPRYLLSSIEKNLVGFVQHTIATLRYSVYKLGGTHMDTSHGVYILDCSSYVDHILKAVYPRAYSSLVSSTGTEKPTTDDYYHYFTNLSDHAKHWNTIDDVEKLRPGDILVFRYKNSLGYERGGHVMIVMDKPTQEGDTFKVRVTDSASGGHSKDTRKARTSGIGIGTMLLKVSPKTYQPYAYAWRIGSRWESNVNFAMARPLDIEEG